MSFKNYKAIFLATGAAKNYFVWYKNSIVITFLFTLISLLLWSMVGYDLAIYRFFGGNFVFSLVLVTMMVPVEIIILPLYKETIARIHGHPSSAGQLEQFFIADHCHAKNGQIYAAYLVRIFPTFFHRRSYCWLSQRLNKTIEDESGVGK